jgi:hypothetical protein
MALWAWYNPNRAPDDLECSKTTGAKFENNRDFVSVAGRVGDNLQSQLFRVEGVPVRTQSGGHSFLDRRPQVDQALEEIYGLRIDTTLRLAADRNRPKA